MRSCFPIAGSEAHTVLANADKEGMASFAPHLTNSVLVVDGKILSWRHRIQDSQHKALSGVLSESHNFTSVQPAHLQNRHNNVMHC